MGYIDLVVPILHPVAQHYLSFFSYVFEYDLRIDETKYTNVVGIEQIGPTMSMCQPHDTIPCVLVSHVLLCMGVRWVLYVRVLYHGSPKCPDLPHG